MASPSVPNSRSASPSPNPDLAALMQSMFQKQEENRRADMQAMQAKLDEKFDAMEKRAERTEEKLDRALEQIAAKHSQLESEVRSIRTDVAGVELRVEEIDSQIQDLATKVKSKGQQTGALNAASLKRVEKLVEDKVKECGGELMEKIQERWEITGVNNGSPQIRKTKELVPPSYDGKSNPVEYLSLFERLAQRNGWGHEEKGIRLLTLLKSDAEEAAVALQGDDRVNFARLSDVLVRRFKRHPDLAKQNFHNRMQKRGEGVAELALCLQTLIVEAYPDLNEEARSSLVKERFVAALADDEVKYEVQKAAPQDLAQAEHIATITETARRQVRQDRQVRQIARDKRDEKEPDITPTDKRLISLERAVDKLTNSLTQPKSTTDSCIGHSQNHHHPPPANQPWQPTSRPPHQSVPPSRYHHNRPPTPRPQGNGPLPGYCPPPGQPRWGPLLR